MKKILAAILAVSMFLCLAGCGNKQGIADFYAKVGENTALMDTLANEIIASDSVSVLANHSDELAKIAALDAEIVELYKEIKNDSKLRDTLGRVMDDYSDYYHALTDPNRAHELEIWMQTVTDDLRALSYEVE